MGKFEKFGESLMIRPTKTIQIILVLTINNLLADLLICQNILYQMLKKSKFAKLFVCQTFPLYSIIIICIETINML